MLWSITIGLLLFVSMMLIFIHNLLVELRDDMRNWFMWFQEKVNK